jgi:pilus assembly protein Flp/PilA
MRKLIRFMKDEAGATAVEYGLIAAATGLALAAAMPAIESGLSTVLGSVGDKLN